MLNGFIPDIQLNNSNTSSTSSYEYYISNALKLKNSQYQRQFLDYQKQKLLSNGYHQVVNSNENDTLLSKLDYYTLRMNNKTKNKFINDDLNANLKVSFHPSPSNLVA